MQGGAYVLSRAAVRRFVEQALPNKSLCLQDDTGYEDNEMGKCLQNVGVKYLDSRDQLGKYLFLPESPQISMMELPANSNIYWYYPYIEVNWLWEEARMLKLQAKLQIFRKIRL